MPMTYTVHKGEVVLMSFRRWIPTFLGFPLGGLLAIEAVGGVDGPASAAAGGLVAGAAIGAAQWLALRTTPRWILHTAVAMAAGSALAATLTDAGSQLADLVVFGVVAGAAVGAAQAALLRSGRALWIAATTVARAAGRAGTASIGVDVERGYQVFGASGALLATLVTGAALAAGAAPRAAAAA